MMGPDGEPRFFAPEFGHVVDDQDPKGLGRVRVSVPAIYPDEGGPWAWPFGGGGNEDGIWNPPKPGSMVIVLFRGGDPQYPLYSRAHHPQGKEPEVVQLAKSEAVAEDVPVVSTQVRTVETRDWDITIDERPGRRLFRVRAKDLGSQNPDGTSLMIELDREAGVLALSAPAGISIKTNGRLSLDGLVADIQDREVIRGIEKAV